MELFTLLTVNVCETDEPHGMDTVLGESVKDGFTVVAVPVIVIFLNCLKYIR